MSFKGPEIYVTLLLGFSQDVAKVGQVSTYGLKINYVHNKFVSSHMNKGPDLWCQANTLYTTSEEILIKLCFS